MRILRFIAILYFASWLFSGSTHTCSGSVISTEAADGKNKSEAFYGVDADGHAFERFIRPILSKYTIAGTPQLSLRRKLRHDTLRRPRCRSSPRRPKRQATYLMNARQGGEFSWNTTHTPPGRGFGGGAAAPGTVENGTNFMPDLAYGMKMDPKMKVMLAGGYYDLATPYFEGVYEMRHLPMPHNLQSNISYHYYDAGHMIYVKDDILKQFKIDIANFIKSSETANNPARLASPTGQHAFALALSVPFRSSAVAVAIALALV